MTSIFLDARVLYVDYLDKCYTITKAYYADLLIKQIRRGKLTRGVFFHQNNTPAHTSTVGTDEIQKCGSQLVEHPPYSSDLVSSDYYLFPKRNKNQQTNNKKTTKIFGHHCARDNDLMKYVDHLLTTMASSTQKIRVCSMTCVRRGLC